ncbi:acyl carrier protein [Trebonia sp.]|uniref:acyl carrier protein n=1 Tax=Trebonia sp. TaxID=2767075 RepID=UPI00261E6748|nr:phosphopantetheine-binding protein [Trebonia sp.]
MAGDSVIKPIAEFIAVRFPDVGLGPDDDIFALGFVNSLFAMELVMFLETTFAFTVPNEALRLDSFRSLNAMAALVAEHAGLAVEPGPR